MRRLRKMVSVFLSLVMIMNMTSIFTTTVFATDAKNKSYFGENYKVDYSIKDSWGNNQIIEVKLTNTGIENIENWALKFNADGEIKDLWGGNSNKHDGTQYVIESAPYNLLLKPNQTITFGYKYVSEKGEIPKSFELCSKRVEKKSGYTADFKVLSSGDNQSTCQIEIKNSTQNPIKLWELAFDGDFNIIDIWNAKLIKSENGKHLIKSIEDTNIIQPNSSVIISMRCNKENNIDISNEKLSEVVIDTSSNIVDLKLFVFGEYNEENNSIMLQWSTTIPKGAFEIKVSEDDNNFTTVTTVTEAIEYEYKIMNSSEKYYFKIVQTLESGKSVESNTITMVKKDYGYELNLEDTDKDGLPDIYENMIGTDPLKPDTDGDSLNDREEVSVTYTDPLKVDTDNNGITDPNEDFDNDNLTNIDEIKLGTNPHNNDTDDDGLNDGDEINKYKTNPLLADTDEDGINDGDEIKLGLNPLSKFTNNDVLDSDVMFEQKISTEIMDNVNTADNLFELDVQIKSTGYANSNLIVGQSSYSTAMTGNNAIQGMPVELNYISGNVEKATIKFKLKDSLLSKENESAEKSLIEASKLERYHIFRYDEENGLLYPVKTQEDGDMIYTETNKLGTYCVMDLVEWDKSLQDKSQLQTPSLISAEKEIELPIIEQQQEIIASEQIVQINGILSTKDEQQRNELCEKLLQEQIDEILLFDSQNKTDIKFISQEDKKKIDIVLAVDSTRLMANGLDLEHPNFSNSYCTQSTFFIYNLINSMNRKGNIDWRICLIDFKKYPDDGESARTIYTAPDGGVWFNKGSDIVEKLNIIEQKTKVAKKSSQTSWDSLGYATEELVYRDGAARHSILMTNQITKNENRYNIQDINQMSNLLLKKGIMTHFVTDMDCIDYYTPLRKTTKGLYAFYFYNFILYFPQSTVDYIISADPLPIGDSINVITSYGLEKIDISNIFGEHLDEDLDGDGLTNKQEIRTDWLKDGKVALDNLMTLKQFSEKVDKNSIEIDRFSKELLAKNADLLVLPLKSDPRKIDSDGDEITDGTKLLGSAKYTNDDFPLRYSFKYYDKELSVLHLQHPTWKFDFEKINVNLEDFIRAEYEHNNPVPKAFDNTKYNPKLKPNPYVETDSEIKEKRAKQADLADGAYFLSTYEGVSHFVSIDTYLTENSIFSLLDLDIKQEDTTLENAKSMLKNTYFDTNPGDLDKFAKIFCEASIKNRINLSFLIANCLTECAAGKKGSCSELCKGYNYNGKTVYNMYGIGANDGNAVWLGAKSAKAHEWFDQKTAIIGGAEWIYNKYVSRGQDTLYTQRYNYIDYYKSNQIINQYGSAINMAFTKGNDMYKSSDNIKNLNLRFKIPLFN